MSDKKIDNTSNSYGDDAIVTLSPREHIRLRPGMYIGKLGDGSQADDGIYVLLKEVIDNCIDEFVMGHGRHIEVTISPDQAVTVRERDSMTQERIALDQVRDYLAARLPGC